MTKIDPVDKAIDAVTEYVKKRDGVVWTGEEWNQYKPILATDEKFHDYAFFNYGLLIKYYKTIEKLHIHKLRGFSKYSKEELVSLKTGIDKFGSVEEYFASQKK